MYRISVMFLSARHSARGQMAEAFLKQHGGDRFDVHSSGLNPQTIHPLALQVMEELGISMQNQQPRDVKDFLGQNFHFLITVCKDDDRDRPIFPGTSFRLYWPFEDPTLEEGTHDEKLQFFRKVRDQIRSQVLAWIAELEGQTHPTRAQRTP